MNIELANEKFKYELKNSLNRVFEHQVQSIDSITFLEANFNSNNYFDLKIRVCGQYEDPEVSIKTNELRLSKSLLDKINEDKKKHGYKEIETMIVDALDNYYEGC